VSLDNKNNDLLWVHFFLLKPKNPTQSQPQGDRIHVRKVALRRYEVKRTASYLDATWDFWLMQWQWGGIFRKFFDFINTLRTGEADLRLYITTVQDG
jgi:hypothetical protein